MLDFAILVSGITRWVTSTQNMNLNLFFCFKVLAFYVSGNATDHVIDIRVL